MIAPLWHKILAVIVSLLKRVYHHRNLLQQLDIAKDYMDVKRHCRFLKEQPESSGGNGRKILVVSLTQFLYQVKLEAILAKALQISGCDVEILTWRHCFWPEKYFRLHGFEKFTYFDDYIDRFLAGDVSADCEGFLSQDLSLQNIKSWRFKGCRVGQQVLGTMGRAKYGMPDLTDAKMRRQFGKKLWQNIKAIYAAHALFSERNFDILLFNEANGMYYGGVFDVAFRKRKSIIQFVQPLRDDSLIFKRYDEESFGLHPNSLSQSTFERIKSFAWTPKHEERLWEEFESRYGGKWFLSSRNFSDARQKDKNEIIRQLGLDPAKKTAVLFSHVLWDANLFYGEDIFEDYEEWFVETIKAACRNPLVNWVIKLHPSNVWKRNREGVTGELRESVLIREKIGDLPKHIFLVYPETNISALSFFKLADYGITSRGTVGMELPCFGVPVLTAGTGRYSGLGFTVDSSSKEEYLEKIGHIAEIPPLTGEQVLLAKKYAFAVFNLRPWVMQSVRPQFRYKKRGAHPLDHNCRCTALSWESLKASGDLKKFSSWALNSGSPDYLENWNTA